MMTVTITLPSPGKGIRNMVGRLARTAGFLGGAAASVIKAKVQPAARQLRDHAYSIAGLAFIDAAMFDHSVFTGLLVTGISFFAFEFKVAGE